MAAARGRLTFRSMAAVFDLNHHATYVHFHVGGGTTPFFVFDMSLSNVLLIAAMLIVFVAAIMLPFPHRASAGGSQ